MKSKKRWFVTALTACLTLSLGICAEALEYDFDGVEDTEYYPSYNNNYGLRRGSQPRLFPSQSRSC